MTEQDRVWISAVGDKRELVINGLDVTHMVRRVSVEIGNRGEPAAVAVEFVPDVVRVDTDADDLSLLGIHHPLTTETIDALRRKAKAMRRECTDGDRCQHAEGIDMAADIVRHEQGWEA